MRLFYNGNTQDLEPNILMLFYDLFYGKKKMGR